VTIRDIVETLPAYVACGQQGYQDMTPGKIVAGDIMSDLLVSVETDIFLVTSLATDQTIRSADLMGATTVMLVNDKLPTPGMKALAIECGIALMSTPLPMYEACIALCSLQDADNK
jgi:hypothetical protein